MDERQQQMERDLAERLARIVDPGSLQAVGAAAAFLLTVYVGLALAYRDAVPLFEAPDEPSHIHHAVFIYNHGRLPRHDPLEVPGEGMQAPLVYLVAAPLLGNTGIDMNAAERSLEKAMFPFYSVPQAAGGSPALFVKPHGARVFGSDGTLEPLRVLRSTSLVFGLLTVILTFAAVWRISRDARIALLAGALLAFNPEFLFTSAYFSNDPAAAATGAAALWVVVRAFEDAPRGTMRRHYVVGAILFGLAALTKTSALPGLAAAAVTLVAIDRRPRRERMIDVGIAAAIALVLAGPYAVWAAEHRGGPLGMHAVTASAAVMLRAEDYGGLWGYLKGIYWDKTLESYWALFGWFIVPAPKATYLAFFALTFSGVLGWIAGRSRELWEPLRSRALRGYLFGSAGATLASHFLLNLFIASPQGRILFASAAQIALLLALGLYRLIGSERRMLRLALSVVFVLLVLDVYCLRGVLVPAYWESAAR